MTLDKTALLPEGLEAAKAVYNDRSQPTFRSLEAAITAYLAAPRPSAGAGEVEALLDSLMGAVSRCSMHTTHEAAERLRREMRRSLIVHQRASPQDDGKCLVGYLKPKHPAARGPFYIDAADRIDDWQKAIFTIPVFAALPPPPEAV